MKVLTIIFWSLLLVACNNNRRPGTAKTIADTSSLKSAGTSTADEDSLALLQLTQKLYQWEEESNGIDYDPYLATPEDTLYSSIDMDSHQKRLKEIKETGLFTRSFIDNYQKIALEINKELKENRLTWKVGELPPFGNGANPWCNCQDTPDNYLHKIRIMHLNFKNDTASYNWSWGDGLVYQIKAVKENNVWKIAYLEGFDYDAYTRSFVYTDKIEGSWENGLVRIDIGDTNLTLWYHGQCVYFYPIRKINGQTIEMTWDRDMDCKFDNGTGETFGLKKHPVKGQPFAQFVLRNDTLYASYYYREWVREYTRQVQDEVFTSTYSRRRELY